VDRASYIGGADAAGILGRNPFQTVLKIWRKKIGIEFDDLDNHHIRRGNTMESIIEDYCVENLDSTINSEEMFKRFGKNGALGRYIDWEYDGGPFSSKPKPQITILHDVHTFCGGHPDGLTKDTVWEFKAPAMRNFKYINSNGVSESWILQVQYYMWITGLPQAKICVWDYDEWRPLVVRIHPNKRVHAAFEEFLPAFWFHVETQTEPNFEGIPDEFDFRHDELLDELCFEYARLTDDKAEREPRIKHLKYAIMTYLNGQECLTTDEHYVTAKEQTRFGKTFPVLRVAPVESRSKEEKIIWRNDKNLARSLQEIQESGLKLSKAQQQKLDAII